MREPATRPPYPDLDAGVSPAALAQLDEAATCAEHWKILVTAGMGLLPEPKGLSLEELTETGLPGRAPAGRAVERLPSRAPRP